MRCRGNFNGGKAGVPAPYSLTKFEQQVEELGLRPDQYQASPELRRWCRRNANIRYVPEDLLGLWGIKVKERMSEPAPMHSATSAADREEFVIKINAGTKGRKEGPMTCFTESFCGELGAIPDELPLGVRPRPELEQINGAGTVPLAVTNAGIGLAWNWVKSDAKATAAVTALHKLAVQTKCGINLTDYIPTAREAYSAVELFLQSDNAKRSVEFSRMLANTVKWYKAAAMLYRRKLTKTTGERLSSIALCWDAHYPDSGNVALFTKYHELRAAFKEDGGKEPSYLSYADMPQEAWRLADAELAKVDKYMK